MRTFNCTILFVRKKQSTRFSVYYILIITSSAYKRSFIFLWDWVYAATMRLLFHFFKRISQTSWDYGKVVNEILNAKGIRKTIGTYNIAIFFINEVYVIL